ncbi:MAG: hypothetical protein ACFCVA_10340 [Gammaproteobacteria bacterium]
MGIEGLDQEGAAPVAVDQQRLEALLIEAKHYVTNRQLDLQASLVGDEVVISGHFIVTGADGPFDSFEIEVRFRVDFPLAEPRVFETGGRVPKVADRHIYEGSGRCCTGVWEEAFLNPAVHSIAGFMDTLVNDYFVSQTYFEVNQSWPYGDRSHGKLGVLEACCDLLGIAQDPKVCIDDDVLSCWGIVEGTSPLHVR